MKPILFPLFTPAVINIDEEIIEKGNLTLHQFPDDETYIQIHSIVKDRQVILMASLDHPNEKLLSLLLIRDTLKDLGAKEIGLIAPYLAYMRQDKRFKPGEGITAKYFADLISRHFNWLITIDPHLHRIKQLTEVYSIPTTVLHVIEPIAQWIKKTIENPLIIGPDDESRQWVASVAEYLNAPYVVAKKNRKGASKVEITIPCLNSYCNYTPVILDDIISTANTMIQTIRLLKKENLRNPVCIGIHAIFAGSSYETLLGSGAQQVVTCNTIKHASNSIALDKLVTEALKEKVMS